MFPLQFIIKLVLFIDKLESKIKILRTYSIIDKETSHKNIR